MDMISAHRNSFTHNRKRPANFASLLLQTTAQLQLFLTEPSMTQFRHFSLVKNSASMAASALPLSMILVIRRYSVIVTPLIRQELFMVDDTAKAGKLSIHPRHLLRPCQPLLQCRSLHPQPSRPLDLPLFRCQRLALFPRQFAILKHPKTKG